MFCDYIVSTVFFHYPKELDCRLSEHVMALHSGSGDKTGYLSSSKSKNTSFNFASTISNDDDSDKPLR